MADKKKIREHLEEPLLAIAVTTFLFTQMLAWFGKGTLSDAITMAILLMGLASAYMTYRYVRADRENIRYVGVPILMAVTLSLLMKAREHGTFLERDYMAFAMISSIFLLFYTLYTHRMLGMGKAMISAIILSGLIIHLAPAVYMEGIYWHGKYLMALDPYFYYRYAENMASTGFIPEKEILTYPTNPPDFYTMTLMMVMFMGSIGTVLQMVGVSVHDIAMVYPGVYGALTALPLYLLMKELFSDNRPHNKAVALMASAALILSTTYASKAIASNCEDDALGMFLFVSALLFFTWARKKKRFDFAALAGLTMLIFAMTWGAYLYAILVIGGFTATNVVVKFIGKRNCMEDIPYFAMTILPTQLMHLIIHKQGAIAIDIPRMIHMNWVFYMTFIGTILLASILETIRVRKYGRIQIGRRIEDYQRYAPLIVASILLPMAIVFLTMAVEIDGVQQPIPNALLIELKSLMSTKTHDIIAQTTSEQNPTCSAINKDCLNVMIDRFGISALFGVFAIPLLAYMALAKKSEGAMFVLIWSLPMFYGVVDRAAYSFNASAPIAALGSTILLAIPLSRKEMNGIRVIPLIVVAGMLLAYSQPPLYILEPFGGTKAMYMGAGGDRIFWEPTLQWLKENVGDNETIITWWDYGHWIAAVSGKSSLLDNTKARPLMVQDIAKLHILIENETEAVEMMRKYNSRYFVIDYTMIGKSGAPYYIATSNVTSQTPGEAMSYATCRFRPEYSDLQGTLTPKGNGEFDMVKTVLFDCSGLGLQFEITDDRISNIYAIVEQSKRISWQAWQQETKASILGVHSPSDILGNSLTFGTDAYFDFPTYTVLIYVPDQLNRKMMTSLYLGDHMDEYKAVGLCHPSVQKLEHFRLVDGFLGDKQDTSYYGYVRIYEVINDD